MSLSDKQLCVFCGKAPTTKTREHVIPYWLLEMTGDPRRVVTFGQNFKKRKEPIRFAWSAFVAPACDPCNNKYASLEERAKISVETLLHRGELKGSAYVDLLDWLDKVRIGVWLMRHMLENHPIEISPHFHIDARVSSKDRMIAVYVFDSGNKGINLFGTDSLIFNHAPSCFGVRINDILLLNFSADYFCSKGCGLPYPKITKLLMGGENPGKLSLEEFQYEANISNPITSVALYKPVVWLYQPIKQLTDNPNFKGGYLGFTNLKDACLAERTLIGNEQQGALFRQYADRVEILRDPNVSIEFDEVVGKSTAPMGDIAASIYEAQIAQFKAVNYEWIEPSRANKNWKRYRKLQVDHTKELAEMYRKKSR